MKSKTKHLIEFGFILVYVLGFILAFQNYSGEYESKLIFSVTLPLFYLLWSVMHHYFEGRLTKAIFTEYLSISLFIFIILFTATNI